MCFRDSYVYKNVFFVILFMKVMSGRLKCIVLSVSMLRLQYSLKLSFSINIIIIIIIIIIIDKNKSFVWHQNSLKHHEGTPKKIINTKKLVA